MEQRAVLEKITQTKEAKPAYKEKWLRLMHLFYTEDVSPDNHSLINLQRRATWLGIALVLQAPNEFLGQYSAIISFLSILGSLVAIMMALRPNSKGKRQKEAQQQHLHPRRWQKIALVIILLMTIGGFVEFGETVLMSFMAPQFSNDGTSLDTNAAILLLEGRNPYANSSILTLARRFDIQPNWTTPLQLGQFADMKNYPSMTDFQTVLDTDLKAGKAPEFESKVSYPTLSFLTLIPFVLVKDYNVLPFYLLSYLLLVAIGWKIVRPEMRPWVLLLSLVNVTMWSSVMGSNLDIFVSLLLVLAWLMRDRRWASAVFLGLAFASKQTSWFLAPFYLILVFRHYGWKETLYRGTIAGALCLAFNMPFILWNPQAWLAGIMAPVADPMFPMGVGIVGLSTGHLLPFLPKWCYDLLEMLAMIGSLVWYWRVCKRTPEAALMLAMLPLFMAWRSLSSYFYCIAYPIFILMAAHLPTARKLLPEKVAQRALNLIPAPRQRLVPGIPAAAGMQMPYYNANTQLYRRL
jgi:uncharacterized membrane protein